MYANYAFVAVLFSVAGFVLGRGTYCIPNQMR